jgi:hypothetical protein
MRQARWGPNLPLSGVQKDRFMVEKRLVLRLVEVAELIGMSDEFVRCEIKRGNLRARKLGRFNVVTQADLAAYIAALPVTNPPDPDSHTSSPASPAIVPPKQTRHKRVEKRLYPILPPGYTQERTPR